MSQVRQYKIYIRKKVEIKGFFFFFFFHFPPFILGIKTSSTLLTKLKQNTGHIYHIFLPVALAHPHPTKRDQKKKKKPGAQQQNQFYLTTFTKTGTRIHCKIERGVICSVTEGFSVVSYARCATVIEHAVCQIQTYLQHMSDLRKDGEHSRN